MSMKLVPVWSVTIEPSGIGVPVAATPGLVPHDEVATEPVPELALPLALAVAGALLDDAPLVGADEELLLLLLLHPARTPPIAMTATAAPASRERRCSYLFMGSAFSWLTAKYFRTIRCAARGLGPLRGEWRKSTSLNGASLHCLCIACDVVYVLEAIECFAEVIAKAGVR